MKRDTPLQDWMKKVHLPDKAALWIIVFVAFALLCLIFLFTVKPLILKLLFLLLGIGAAGYCWILVESRRIAPKPGQADSSSVPSHNVPVSEVKIEKPEEVETADSAQEAPQSAGQEDDLVFVSEKGDKYHLDRNCVGLRFADSVDAMTEEKAVSLLRKPCSKCRKKTKAEAI